MNESLTTDNPLDPFPVRRPPIEPVPLGPLPANPLVSIIVPSFRQGKFIRATIDSILSQDYRPIQIHVIDGGSQDETVDVLKSYGDIPELKWISERDQGVVHAVNKGFARAQGDIVAIQSSDDCYLPGAIRTMVGVLQSQPDVGLAYGDTVKIDSHGRELSRHVIGSFTLEKLLLLQTWVPQPSAFFRREVLLVCGGWNPAIPYAPDSDLWIRMAFRTKVVKVDSFLSQYRVHEEQRDTQASRISRDFDKMIDENPDIIASSPDLQRMAQAGKHLQRVRYNPTGSDWGAALSLWRARRCYPSAASLQNVLWHLTLPARRVGSRIKQSLRF